MGGLPVLLMLGFVDGVAPRCYLTFWWDLGR